MAPATKFAIAALSPAFLLAIEGIAIKQLSGLEGGGGWHPTIGLDNNS
jgi:hypothetical protein